MAPDGALDRRKAVRLLLAERGDLLVVTGLGSPSYDVFDAGDHDGTFYLWGAMGGAAMVGLGLALAQPSRPVAVITGDGEQLMAAGALMTIAAKKPGNLTVAVLDNGHFGETGMQVSHSGLGVRLDAVARACGFPATAALATEEDLAAYRPELARLSGGPRFARIPIATGHVERALPPRDGAYLKTRFRRHLGIRVG
ncbi:hypothetical protein OPKNFCMD_6443 [Methylobacterium crusticola]|uniref:Thiamine pyrophosphate enzyme TPP-binding domain-containing protein n=1 Tax=Methylobacterium crusticola TaxID=1697972 RepID=A0ABQ4R8L0_9HYPH|nr:thiamine pyrophosphate-dependent enzyme [Methylobacterium crusticola]GJD53666.1 hypothetical protein OPKNFCMD_6443 [Methylobacterium crusticola]